MSVLGRRPSFVVVFSTSFSCRHLFARRICTYDSFVTTSLYKIQFSFINCIIKQLMLRVDRVDCSVWLAEQLQLHENKILVKIVHIAFEMMF
jgi:hypothetical protein